MDVLQELVPVYCILDDKIIIHIPTSQSWSTACCSDGLGFKVLCEKAGHYWACG